jgi:hypothetical protein
MTSHFRSKGMSRVFTWLPGDEPPSCQTATGVGDVINSTVERPVRPLLGYC